MIKLIIRALKLGGGLFSTIRLLVFVLASEGFNGVRWRLNVAKRLNYLDDIAMGSPVRRVDYNKGYDKWIKKNEPKITTSSEQNSFESGAPFISLLMPVYKTPIEWLDKAIDSIIRQSYPRWELCVVDDASNDATLTRRLSYWAGMDSRIRLEQRSINGHISVASNTALEMAAGQFIGLFDHDDELSLNALEEIALAIRRRPDAEVIYSDEDKIDAMGRRHDPYFKSEFNPVLFLAQNMISHFGVYRTSSARAVGGFREGFEGAQDWDLALRVIDAVGADKVVHIPKVLYHWRKIKGSTARGVDEKNYATKAQLAAVKSHLQRKARAADVVPAPHVPGMVRVRHHLPAPQPTVSIIIPTRDQFKLLHTCVESLMSITKYDSIEIVVVDNGTSEKEALGYLERLESFPHIQVKQNACGFNFSALINFGARFAAGEILLLLNNDIEVTHADWLAEMVSWAILPETGCVGAKLWYPDGSLQHGGVILGISGLAGHAHRGLSKIDPGYVGRAAVHQNLTAVTGACLMVRRDVYDKVGGLDEQFAVAYNDLDFCLRVQAAGYRNVWTPYADLIHHESATRSADADPVSRARLNQEISFMNSRWGHVIAGDPAYSKNLTRLSEDFTINV